MGTVENKTPFPQYDVTTMKLSEFSLFLAILISGSSLASGLACHQCTTEDDQGLACIDELDSPKECKDGQNYCIVMSQFLIKNTSNSASTKDIQNTPDQKLLFLARSCVHTYTGDDCDIGKDEKTGKSLLVCRVHCSNDGCNSGDKLLIPLLFYLILLIIPWKL